MSRWGKLDWAALKRQRRGAAMRADCKKDCKKRDCKKRDCKKRDCKKKTEKDCRANYLRTREPPPTNASLASIKL